MSDLGKTIDEEKAIENLNRASQKSRFHWHIQRPASGDRAAPGP